MSGPKVVRIVTLEEILVICEGHLARVDAAMQEWRRIGQLNDCLSDADAAQAEGRIARLRALLTAGEFVELQKQAPKEIAFLNQDMQARLDQVAVAAVRARTVSRRQVEAAVALSAALEKKGVSLGPDLATALRRAAEGQPDPQALSRGFALLSAESTVNAVDRRALAQSLQDAVGAETLADWIAAQPAAPADVMLEGIDKLLVELSHLAGTEATGSFEARLAGAMAPGAERRRGLLLTSLNLDLSRALSKARQSEAHVQELRLTLAELRLIDGEAAQAISARAERPGADPAQLLAETQATLAKVRDALGANARRAAVLQSLAGLGYEVSEGLATAWVENGRVVIRKAAQPDYGVEISGDPPGDRMQMRVVTFRDETAAADPARDQDAETLWCGDVATLQSGLAASGGELVIERGRAVGATPVKRVAAPAGALSRAAREGPAQQTRSHS